MFVKDILGKKENNFNLLRVVLASMVIIYHSFAIFNDRAISDPIIKYLGVISTGGLAVKTFFFLSGMLVTKSLMNNGSFLRFVKSRLNRILPAYFCVILISALVIGPLISQLTYADYFSDKNTWLYIFNNFALNTAYLIPGVFIHSKFGFNGSIWTIPLEIACYSILAIYIISIKIMKMPNPLFLCLLVIIAPLTPLRDWLFNSNGASAIYMLAPCFALGCITAILKNNLKVMFMPYFVLFLLGFFVDNNILKNYLFCFSFCMICLYLFTTKISKKIRIQDDVSYGMYLWGFPIQQIIANNVTTNLVLSCLASLVAAYLVGQVSWRVIEKPFIDKFSVR